MCDECISSSIEVDHKYGEYNKIINRFKANKKPNDYVYCYHCLTGPARVFFKDNKIIGGHWYINGEYVSNVPNAFEKSLLYKKWKLRGFS